MAFITLAEAKVGMANKVDQAIIDKFERGSLLMSLMMFDDAVSPGTGGSTMAYSYMQLKTPSTAGFRALNTEYTNNQAIKEAKTVLLKILGGSYKIDRVLIGTSGAVDELEFQIEQKQKGTANTFHNAVINGDVSDDVLEFDGLDVLLTGSSTELIPVTPIDLSTSALMTANFDEFLDLLTEFLGNMSVKPGALLMNGKMLVKMKSVARRAGYFEQTKDDFGRTVDMYDGIPMIDLDKFYNGTTSVDVVEIDGATGTTSIYAVALNEKDGFIGVTPNGSSIIRSFTPDLNAPGTIKEGDVEMVTGVALKDSRKAAVLRNIKVQAGV